MSSHDRPTFSRRRFLSAVGGASALALWPGAAVLAPPTRPPRPGTMITKTIPASGESIPAVGMGTWITFNVGADRALREQRTEVLRAFFRHGGGVIDCSPMYGSSADVLGYALERIDNTDRLFAAGKVWTSWRGEGREQMQQQRRRWGIKQFDLQQVHNLRNWEGHLETLREAKAQGEIRYIGVTTSHGRRHDELEKIMRSQDLDFIQLTYNILDREAEQRLLPLAIERGIAVIANRPFRQKALFHRFQDKPLPSWAEQEAGAINWSEFFLKFILSHPAVTCAIPATSQVQHMKENMGAGYGRLPDEKTRARMIEYLELF